MPVKSAYGGKQPNPGPALDGNGCATSQFASPPIQVNRWARNGKHPNALLESLKNEAGNQAALFRTKEVFRSTGSLLSLGSTGIAGDRPRWRWYWHSGPYTRFLNVFVTMFAPTASTLSGYARLDLSDGQSVTFYYGRDHGIVGLESIVQQTQQVTIQPDTDYYATLVDVDGGILHAACAYELASMTEFFGGYLTQNAVGGGPILDKARQNVAVLTNNLWLRGGAQLISFSVDDGTAPLTSTAGTWLNVYDPSGPNLGPGGPGHYLDLRNHARASQPGVAIVMQVYGNGGGSTGLQVALVDQGGNQVAYLQTFQSSPGWVATTLGGLLAAPGKYSLLFNGSVGGTNALYAVSVYELDVTGVLTAPNKQQ